MRQFSWLELHEGKWHLITKIGNGPSVCDRSWSDRDSAILELSFEGWEISYTYRNPIFKMRDLNQRIQRYSLRRTIHWGWILRNFGVFATSCYKSKSRNFKGFKIWFEQFPELSDYSCLADNAVDLSANWDLGLLGDNFVSGVWNLSPKPS